MIKIEKSTLDKIPIFGADDPSCFKHLKIKFKKNSYIKFDFTKFILFNEQALSMLKTFENNIHFFNFEAGIKGLKRSAKNYNSIFF